MAGFQSWRPVELAARVRRRPVRCRVLGNDIVLFRDETGRCGAMSDRCPHRGMRLSRGRVDGQHLVCPYHGWKFDCHGGVVSPGNPQLRARATTYEVAEAFGLVWLRDRRASNASTKSPEELFAEDALVHFHSTCRKVDAAATTMLDNFTEVEHTASAHWIFGYDPAAIAQISTVNTFTSDVVSVTTRGPQKRMPLLARIAMETRQGDMLVCSWETRTDPISTVWKWWWEDPLTGKRRPRLQKAVAYINPIDDGQCQLITFYFSDKPTSAIRQIIHKMSLPFVRAGVEYEIRRDLRLVENVVDMDGKGVVGRFDHALVEQRRRILRQSAEESSTNLQNSNNK